MGEAGLCGPSGCSRGQQPSRDPPSRGPCGRYPQQRSHPLARQGGGCASAGTARGRCRGLASVLLLRTNLAARLTRVTTPEPTRLLNISALATPLHPAAPLEPTRHRDARRRDALFSRCGTGCNNGSIPRGSWFIALSRFTSNSRITYKSPAGPRAPVVKPSDVTAPQDASAEDNPLNKAPASAGALGKSPPSPSAQSAGDSREEILISQAALLGVTGRNDGGAGSMVMYCQR